MKKYVFVAPNVWNKKATMSRETIITIFCSLFHCRNKAVTKAASNWRRNVAHILNLYKYFPFKVRSVHQHPGQLSQHHLADFQDKSSWWWTGEWTVGRFWRQSSFVAKRWVKISLAVKRRVKCGKIFKTNLLGSEQISEGWADFQDKAQGWWTGELRVGRFWRQIFLVDGWVKDKQISQAYLLDGERWLMGGQIFKANLLVSERWVKGGQIFNTDLLCGEMMFEGGGGGVVPLKDKLLGWWTGE
jgi:hypothetical protein